MKNNLFVTFADRNYLDQAKQLFSSVYFNAGWKGDYMLMAFDIPEKQLKWFRNKGILVKKCRPISEKIIKGFPPVIFCPFYMFTPEFKKWKNIVFIEGDIIVRASLDALTKIKGFGVVGDVFDCKLGHQFSKKHLMESIYAPSDRAGEELYGRLFNKIKINYNIKELSFNIGVMAFSTDIIRKDTFNRLTELVKEYGRISPFGPQGIFNLFFYRKWRRLPPVYNCYTFHWPKGYNIPPSKIRGIVIHFAGQGAECKPWHPKNHFYKEWKHNFDKAEAIDLKAIPAGKEWSRERIRRYSKYLRSRQRFYPLRNSIDKNLGRIGILMRWILNKKR